MRASMDNDEGHDMNDLFVEAYHEEKVNEKKTMSVEA